MSAPELIESGRVKHMCLDVRGALRWSKALKAKLLVGKTADQAHEYLLDCLQEGKRVLPMCSCEGFDYSGGGCPGRKVSP